MLVGHLDTGVDGKHPALKDAIGHYAEFDLLGAEITPTPAPRDSGEHGTHTAATIAGRPVQGRSVGMAPDAKLASAMVIEGGNAVARVLGGMDWAVGLGVNVISMSLGFRGWWEDFIPIVRILRRHQVLPVFAVGNEGPGTSRSPGNYPQPLSVGAMDKNHTVADFSSSQRFQRRARPARARPHRPGRRGHLGQARRRLAGHGRDVDGDAAHRRASPRCSCRPGRRRRSAGSSGRSSSRARSIRRCRTIAPTAACPMASRHSPC